MCHFIPYLGGFFNKHARETSYSKASLGAFPPIHFAPKNAKLVPAVNFVRASRIFFHAAIYKCFDDFNRTTGSIINLQSGIPMHFVKAIILAIYCDHPAARKCALWGSGCPQCFTSMQHFGRPPLPHELLIRTPGNVAAKKKVFESVS
jgi:hypothetical protein